MGYEYRKKPALVQAVQFLGEDRETKDGLEFKGQDDKPLPKWLLEAICKGVIYRCTFGACVKAIEGEARLRPGHYVIRGALGEIHACDPDIFGLTYEAVSC